MELVRGRRRALAREAFPVTDFHGQAERGQRGNPRRHSRFLTTGVYWLLSARSAIARSRRSRRSSSPGSCRTSWIIGQLGPRHIERLPAATPCLPSTPPALVDDALSQEQFGHAVTGAHQITTRASGRTRVPRGLLRDRRNGHRHNLVQMQQPGQVSCVTPSPSSPDPRPGVATSTAPPPRTRSRSPAGTAPPVPGRTRLIRHRHRTRQIPDPGQNLAVLWRRPPLEDLPRFTVDPRTPPPRACVHIQADTRTLISRCASHILCLSGQDHPHRRTPRSHVSEAPATDPSARLRDLRAEHLLQWEDWQF